MHKVKTLARKEAWDPESKWARYNVFFRHRLPHRKSEIQRAPVGADPDVSNNGYGTDHFEGTPQPDASDAEGAETSQGQQNRVNGVSDETNTGTSTTLNGGVRERKGIKKFFHKDKNRDVESASDSSHAKGKKQQFSLWSQIRYSIFNSWLNVLLIFAPIGIALHFVPTINPVIVFVVNFIAIIPLAGTLSYATEEIAIRVGETLGGLLNATFGNAVELIVSIIALFQDEIVIVQTSLIGSMLSNLLLVMGMCFFFGGINRKKQHFNGEVAQTAASLLSLAIGALIIPTAFSHFANDPNITTDDTLIATNEAGISRGTSVVLLVVYICYLVFQLRTHEDIYRAPSKKVGKQNLFKNPDSKAKGAASQQMVQGANGIAGANLHKDKQEDMQANNEQDGNDGDNDEAEEPTLSLTAAIITLVWSTVLVAVCAEFLVDAINQVVESTGISRVFVGLILLPIVGNAAEHATALTVACKDKMDLAIGVAVGSSMQIALLVLPLVVVIGWIAGKQEMNLNFDPFDVIILFVAVLLVNYLIADGESHWLEGIMLMVLYIIIALVGWFYPNSSGAAASAARR
ncbi:MAG: hypothetical protein GOMPHAMPRED_004587 [Gomphillus americanus]|uniref:Sodium/calcium exchanger membrane region domain-containing protein n=1 Tax=Gomphillus americanus TaxID=1940652 RepID=A0A8H3IU83_9LECA|nr:MAG: hypothetical protein GOMPHAMPRED_004587 [Gomphillus americanus]